MKNAVIIGGGVIGCAIAYYLSKLDHDFTKIILVERNEIAGHASGKAGGFLGKVQQLRNYKINCSHVHGEYG